MYWVGCEQPGKSHPISKSSLSRLLSLAEAFRKFGENHFPHGQKEPTLNPEETWYPPKQFPIEILKLGTPPPLSKEDLDALANYQAPKKIY